jgi:hypothetical protein
LGTGLLVGVVIPLFLTGSGAVDNRRNDCDHRLVQIVNSIERNVEVLTDIQKAQLYNVLEVYSFSAYHFDWTWKSGVVTALLFLSSAASLVLNLVVNDVPLWQVIAMFGVLGFIIFIMSLWNWMSYMRRAI